jgi:hypothetical protein
MQLFAVFPTAEFISRTTPTRIITFPIVTCSLHRITERKQRKQQKLFCFAILMKIVVDGNSAYA